MDRRTDERIAVLLHGAVYQDFGVQYRFYPAPHADCQLRRVIGALSICQAPYREMVCNRDFAVGNHLSMALYAEPVVI